MSERVTANIAMAGVLLMMVFIAVLWRGMWNADERADRAESTLEHVVRMCVQDAQTGAAQCPAGTFSVWPTTTVAP